MLYPTHLALGLIIGKLSGNYPTSLIGSFATDLDHILFCIKKKIFSPKKILELSMDPNDKFGNPRTFLHSYITWFFLSLIAIYINMYIGLVLSAGYLGHLILDMLDTSQFYPFYPLKLKVRGPIEYCSKAELVFAFILYFIFILI